MDDLCVTELCYGAAMWKQRIKAVGNVEISSAVVVEDDFKISRQWYPHLRRDNHSSAVIGMDFSISFPKKSKTTFHPFQ